MTADVSVRAMTVSPGVSTMHISHLPETTSTWPKTHKEGYQMMANPLGGSSGPSSSQRAGGDGSVDGRSVRVLVVDDNAINRRVLAGMVRSQGCEVEMAGNGQDALDQIKGAEDFQLIFMDCEMPGMDGFEATRQIRSRWGDAIPIVAASAYSSEQDQQRCLDCGMNDFMSKPLKRPAVRGVLEKWIPGAFGRGAA